VERGVEEEGVEEPEPVAERRMEERRTVECGLEVGGSKG